MLLKIANFTGKHLCWSLFLIKLQAFRPATLLKRDSNTAATDVLHIREIFSLNMGKNVIMSDVLDRSQCSSKMTFVISSISNTHGRIDKVWFCKRSYIHR